ncbi:MAG: HU family DNA-binding protein [Patescibacteria group bacterium]
MLTIADLKEGLAETAGMTKKKAGECVDLILGSIEHAIVKEDGVMIQGLFSAQVMATKARKGVNPSNGEKIDIPAGKRVAVKVSSALKKKVKA